MLDLIKVFHTPASQELITQLRGVSINLGQIAEKVAANSIMEVTKLSLNAYLSKVPVDTRELRNQHFHTAFSGLEGLVTVDDGIHVGRGKPKPASTLVDILEGRIKEGGPNRTQESIPAPAFDDIIFGSEAKGTSKEFEKKAENELIPAIRTVARVRNFNY